MTVRSEFIGGSSLQLTLIPRYKFFKSLNIYLSNPIIADSYSKLGFLRNKTLKNGKQFKFHFLKQKYLSINENTGRI